MDLGKIFYNTRSYTPIPFVILVLVFAEPTVQSLIIGGAVVLLGALIRAWSVSHAGRTTRSTADYAAPELTTSGPYSFTRNPIYIGNVTIYMGIGIMSMAWFPWLQLAGLVFFSIQYHYIIRGEEGFLEKQFGEPYQKFLENVPRVIPRFTPYNPDGGKGDWGMAFKSERRSLQAYLLTSLIIVAIYILR
ncbi:MAG: protein-S-isoprenylcysteine methyltransferase [Ectothiorhodospiraceae bacterium]|nr:protein-S-isoprenylcysteine methyltransferase [Ectothiorhodospiraceae bacterium]